MAIPDVTKDAIFSALKYIDENGVPEKHKSTEYDLVTTEGKRYPPKYVIAVANKSADGEEISTKGFNAVEAKNFLIREGFVIEGKNQEKSSETSADFNSKTGKFTNEYSSKLLESKNIIFRGAPGTGKTYLAKKIATDIISKGRTDDFSELSDGEKKQVEFVQFHPSYDYSDFIEGLRPRLNDDGSMSFELQDGIFKKFIMRAKKNFEDSLKSKEEIEKEISVQKMMDDFLNDLDLGNPHSMNLKTKNGSEFSIISFDEKKIRVYISEKYSRSILTVRKSDVEKVLKSGTNFKNVKDIAPLLGRESTTQEDSYVFSISNTILVKEQPSPRQDVGLVELKDFIFIVDEINRGEISKIFGELFFSIDPEYRGKTGEVSTQYANLHDDPFEKFYIPENVYIIGTMNDIDRSVDSFDFAMRRRFRFVELLADEHQEMLKSLNDDIRYEAIARMRALNARILDVEGLNQNYQIGASYFLKLRDLSSDQLWTDYLQPLLQDYIQGMEGEAEIMEKFQNAYMLKGQE